MHSFEIHISPSDLDGAPRGEKIKRFNLCRSFAAKSAASSPLFLPLRSQGFLIKKKRVKWKISHIFVSSPHWKRDLKPEEIFSFAAKKESFAIFFVVWRQGKLILGTWHSSGKKDACHISNAMYYVHVTNPAAILIFPWKISFRVMPPRALLPTKRKKNPDDKGFWELYKGEPPSTPNQKWLEDPFLRGGRHNGG